LHFNWEVKQLQTQTLRRGFTLIELLIVVAIIAILAAIAVPNFLEAQTRAKVSRSKADMRSLATAIETYQIDNNKYMHYMGSSDPESVQKIFDEFGVWQTALFRLTSPIAYMTSLPAKSGFGKYRGSSPPHPVLDGYYYMGPDEWAKRNVNPRLYGFPRQWNDLKYSLQGSGPSKEDYNPTKPGSQWTVYDSSNGTLSMGNIWYIKSSSSFHSFN
jgi:prepilin-type N-terminal cleavage/methylation domain-containing protein